MIYRFTSSKVVIARVQRYISSSDWIGTAMMYLGDGIQELGYASKRKNRTGSDKTDNEKITIANHKGELPCDLEFIEKVVYNGCRLPINKDSGMLAIAKTDYIWEKSQRTENWYDIDWPYIITSFEEGNLDLFYRAYDFDNDGFLMIPDIAAYRVALVWYIIQNLILEGYKLKDTSINHSYALAMFEKFESKAKKGVKRMSRDERIAFSSMWNSVNTANIQSQLIR